MTQTSLAQTVSLQNPSAQTQGVRIQGQQVRIQGQQVRIQGQQPVRLQGQQLSLIKASSAAETQASPTPGQVSKPKAQNPGQMQIVRILKPVSIPVVSPLAC